MVGLWRFPVRIWNASIPSLQHSEIGAAWRGLWRPEDFEEYYGADYWEKNKQKWFDPGHSSGCIFLGDVLEHVWISEHTGSCWDCLVENFEDQ